MSSAVEQLQGDLPSAVEDEERRLIIAEHRARIARGEVDLGPAGHSHDPLPHEPIEDTRDMRDPKDLGDAIRYVMANAGLSVLAAADEIDRGLHSVERFDPGESTVTLTVRQRREELERRAAAGDKFAISMLTTGKPGDSDE